ncbi:MAG: hypothetical protein GX771_05330 [Halomonadaceae bacterium]|nr:hypothetical protein [Halomonadaceae bacterium]
MHLINELKRSEDQYKVIGISTGHLPECDMKRLATMGGATGSTMILPRESGVLVKLYESEEPRNLADDYPGLSDAFYCVLGLARDAGFGMVEFDADATAYEGLPWHEW